MKKYHKKRQQALEIIKFIEACDFFEEKPLEASQEADDAVIDKQYIIKLNNNYKFGIDIIIDSEEVIISWFGIGTDGIHYYGNKNNFEYVLNLMSPEMKKIFLYNLNLFI